MPDRFAGHVVRQALEEDDARRDVTTALLGDLGDTLAAGRFLAEMDCVVAGGPVAGEVFRQLDPSVQFEQHIPEGGRAEHGALIATALGPARSLLAGERVALNFLQRLTGIATATRRAVDAVAGTGAIITDTRKTTPGLRALEKYAVRMGGGENHRLSLGDAVLWKDNHWELLERTGRSLAELLRAIPDGMAVTVEVETEEQLEAALAAGVKRILVDNQPPERLAQWVKRAGPAAIEASGGITAEQAAAYAKAGARYVSMGAITHSAPAAAIRLDLQVVA
ncbi:MAG TPA: carboxylating nicotinate-nucleotide diphosphorylase [Gemmatimonadales bacterium]|nr:carboxylating nicotinate-nucleotide diphosphorylase [Gemmatimonadales bacterium]